MNKNYLESSNNTYKIDGLFRPNDVIIPTIQSDLQQCSDLLLLSLIHISEPTRQAEI